MDLHRGLGPYKASMGPAGHLEAPMGFRRGLQPYEIPTESLWGPYGAFMGSLWGLYGVFMGSLCSPYGAFMGSLKGP